jgi:hypothetical protein
MANRQTQGQQQPAKRNPGTHSPDEDDVQREKQSNTADQNQNIDQRKGTRNADTPAEVADEEDGSGGHI